MTYTEEDLKSALIEARAAERFGTAYGEQDRTKWDSIVDTDTWARVVSQSRRLAEGEVGSDQVVADVMKSVRAAQAEAFQAGIEAVGLSMAGRLDAHGMRPPIVNPYQG